MKSEFQDLKAHFGGRASSVQMRDANAKRQEFSTELGSVYTSRLVFTQAGRRIEIAGGQELGRVSVFGEFDVPFFTINSQDRIGFTSLPIGKVKIGAFDYEVFTKDGAVSNSRNRLLRSAELAGLISAHPFRRGEALHFYRNGLVLYARTEDLSSELVRGMAALAEIIPADDEATDLELPSQFLDLASILKEWGIADDLERSDKIGTASEKELRQLLAAVELRLGAINSYLSDSKENTVSDAAANLESLLEATIEARAVLVRRTAQNN